MKRLWRWLVNVLSALSVLLCLATAALWILGLWVAIHARTNSGLWYIHTEANIVTIYHQLAAEPGQLRGASFGWYRPSPLEYKAFGWHPFREKGRHWWNDLGLSGGPNSPYNATVVAYTVPFWLPFLATAVPAALTVGRFLRKRKLKEGHCRKCGYDLRATTDRCPECGTPVPAGHKPTLPDPPPGRVAAR